MPNSNCTGHEHHLCELHGKQMHKNDPGAYAQLVREPKYVCKSCGRVAASDKNLCMPVLLGSWED